MGGQREIIKCRSAFIHRRGGKAPNFDADPVILALARNRRGIWRCCESGSRRRRSLSGLPNKSAALA